MPRPPKWNSLTESVRLPAHAIEACLALAKALDTPLPETTSDPALVRQFADYTSFVQNCAKPKLVTIQKGPVPRLYVLQSEVISFEEYQQVEVALNKLLTLMDAEGLRKDERLYLFSCLVEEVFEPFEPFEVEHG